MKVHSTIHLHSSAEDGYVLLMAIFLMAVLTIALSLAMPVVIRQLQLDRERETMERGKQYSRAIQLYFRKFHAYPPSIDALVMTNNIRFLRKRYTDPMTGVDDWRPILFGQNRAPTAMGFFGEPLSGSGPIGGSTLAGIGPSAGNIGSPAFSTTGTSESLFNIDQKSTNSPGAFADGAETSGNVGSTDSGQSSSAGGETGSNGQTFGGAGIIGFSPGCSKRSIMIYKKRESYDEWEFTYDPMGDPTLLQGNADVGQTPAASMVGVGAGTNGTGPVTTPSPGAPPMDNAPQ